MPRKSLFSRTQQQENGKNSTKSKSALETKLSQTAKLTAAVSSWTEAALEKANMAVLYDFTGSPKQALDAYNEAIELLDKVFGSATDEYMDQTRLKKIYDSYTERVVTLTNQINNNELDLNPSVSIPVAQLSQNPLPSPSASTFEVPELSRNTPTSTSTTTPVPAPAPAPVPAPIPIPAEVSMKHSYDRRPSLSTGASRVDQDSSYQFTSPGSLNISSFLDSKIPAVPPPPVPSKSPKALPPPPKSPSRSLFNSMFVKKHNSKEHLKSTSTSTSTLDPFFSMPGPSKSTPTLSMNRPTKSWKKQSSKKKQRYSSELNKSETMLPPFSSSNIDLASLALPDVEIPTGDDYFDLQSTLETKNLLYLRPEPMLASLCDLHQKDNDRQNQQEENEHIPPDIIGNNNDDTMTKKYTSAPTRTRSSSASSNTTSKYDPPPKSYTSSLMTGNSSVYSPTRSSFYSTTFTYRDEDEYSIASSKYPPSLSLLLPDINTGNNNSSFFDETSDCAMESLAKLLADSAATMPDRSRRTNGPGTSIAAVIEETEPELSSSPSLTTSTITAISANDPDSTQHQPGTFLDRSPSSKSVSSTKSRDSSRSSSSSKRNKNNNSDATSLSIDPLTPLPVNSSKSISFWNKRNKTSSKTKPKTIKQLPPLHMNTDNLTSSTALLSPPGGPNSAPTTPRSIAASIGQAFLSPTSTTMPSSSSSSKRPTPPSAPSTPHHSSFFGAEITAATKSKGIDVDVIMDPSTHNQSNKQPKLMARLLQSMEEGGYVTERIHAPKQLWYQNQVRLPAIDAKISSCEQLLGLLHRMHTHTPHFGDTNQQKDITTEALHDLGRLEHILDQIKQTFGKVTYDLAPPTPTTSPPSQAIQSQQALVASSSYQPASTTPQDHPNQQQQQQQQQQQHLKSKTDPMTLWGNKLSKSVERMRIEAKSSEEQVHAYISTLIRLFSMASVLDEWRDTLMELSGSISMNKAYIYDHILQKTMMCTGTLHTVVCGFVMRDFAILLNKWLKRCREWTLDD